MMNLLSILNISLPTIWSSLIIGFLSCLSINTVRAQTNCQSNNGDISIQHSGFNQNEDFRQQYVLTNKNQLILQIKETFTTPLFQGITSGEYLIYAINYKEMDGVSGIQIGNYIRNITGGCLHISSGLAYQICPSQTTCNAHNGVIQFSNTNYNQNPSFQQTYILVDINSLIIDIQFKPIFSNVESGKYQVYAFNYDRAETIANLTIGQPINAITGKCIDKKGPLFFDVCEEICDNGVDDDKDGKIDCADNDCPEKCICDLKVALTPNIYNDGGTPNNITDDTFTFTATVSGSGTIGWEGGGQTGNYGATTLFGPYPVDSEGVHFQIRDKVNDNCFTSISSNASSCLYLETCTCCGKE